MTTTVVEAELRWMGAICVRYGVACSRSAGCQP